MEDSDSIVYIGASSKREAISLLKEEYGQVDYKFLGIE